ncbi:MAG: hypothetical protein ACOYOK_02185 [Pseudobdellovibrionaceae bacterium]
MIARIIEIAPQSLPVFKSVHLLSLRTDSKQLDGIRTNILPYKIFDKMNVQEFRDWEAIQLNQDWSALLVMTFISIWISTVSWATYVTEKVDQLWIGIVSLTTIVSFLIFFWFSLRILGNGVLSFVKTKKFNIDTLLFIESIAVLIWGVYAFSSQNLNYLYADTVAMSQSFLFFVRTWSRTQALNILEDENRKDPYHECSPFIKIQKYFFILLKMNLISLSCSILLITLFGLPFEYFVSIIILGPVLLCPCLFFSFSLLKPYLMKIYFALSVGYNLFLMILATTGNLSPKYLSLSMIAFFLLLSSGLILKSK